MDAGGGEQGPEPLLRLHVISTCDGVWSCSFHGDETREHTRICILERCETFQVTAPIKGLKMSTAPGIPGLGTVPEKDGRI